MSACGDEDDCISTPEAADLAAKLDEKDINNLPRPGQVEFINGGPPCQVYQASCIVGFDSQATQTMTIPFLLLICRVFLE